MSTPYARLLADVARVVEQARRGAARSVNVIMTTTYWLVGQRIVEQEQRGALRASYGERPFRRRRLRNHTIGRSIATARGSRCRGLTTPAC
jgi:hypothetical protein